MRFEVDDLSRPQVLALIAEHLAQMHATSPRESVHALDAGHLRAPDITVWTAWQGAQLCAIGALRELDPRHGEIKSMRTPQKQRRRGAGRAMLQHLMAQAQARGYQRLSLETGTQDAFAAATALYRAHGFFDCGPFGHYRVDSNSRFLTLAMRS